MSTIKDPWEMLEEARKIIALACDRDPRFDNGLVDRIEAALAERQNSVKGVVEWAEGPFGASQIATVAGWELDVGYVWVSPTKSEWRVSLQRAGESKEELMTTAIAAARGMR